MKLECFLKRKRELLQKQKKENFYKRKDTVFLFLFCIWKKKRLEVSMGGYLDWTVYVNHREQHFEPIIKYLIDGFNYLKGKKVKKGIPWNNKKWVASGSSMGHCTVINVILIKSILCPLEKDRKILKEIET